MPSRFSIKPPSDYRLARDLCSYGYFLLAPHKWDPRRRAFSYVASLPGGPALAELTQPGTKAGSPLRVVTSRTLAKVDRAELIRQLTRMLRLDESAATLRAFHALDPRFKPSGRGRLFRSASFAEDVIKTVTSCNVTWPNTVNMNRRLCETLGQKVVVDGVARYAFPTARKIARTRPATLRVQCRVGYRDARIVELARLFSTPPKKGGLDPAWFENPATPDDDLWAALLDLPGIGPYAAANIMQLLGRYHRLPLDTESVRHAKSVLGMKGSPKQIMKQVDAHFAPMGNHRFRSYWFELWDFYEAKHGPAHTWERDSTGKMFTAALLNK